MIKWLVNLILEFLFGKAVKAGEVASKDEQAHKDNEQNRKDYEDAVKQGDLDAIAKSGESLLNRTKPKSH
jgi:hypothetical protein